MLITDCPICADTATVDESLDAMSCLACGVITEIAPDPVAPALDLAA